MQWVTDAAFEAGVPEEAAKMAGGKIYTSGSYRLRIHEPGSDIDAICVAPQFCTRDLFFSGLKERLIADPLVTHVNAIEIAVVSQEKVGTVMYFLGGAVCCIEK